MSREPTWVKVPTYYCRRCKSLTRVVTHFKGGKQEAPLTECDCTQATGFRQRHIKGLNGEVYTELEPTSLEPKPELELGENKYG